MKNRESSAEIEQQAALWAARLDSHILSPAQQSELDMWRAGDSRRIGALAMAQAALARVEMVQDDLEHHLALASGNEDQHDGLIGRGMSRRKAIYAALSAIAASAVGAIGLGYFRSGRRYSTAKGEMLRVTLPDGSVMNLNTASVAEVNYTPERRTITLNEGEALFDVAKDKARPFVVVAGETRVQAIGTAFTVRHDRKQPVDVMVSKGVIEISQADIARPAMRLSAGMRARVDPQARQPINTQHITPTIIEQQLYWREGKIAFSDTTLERAAAEFSRYNDERILFDDPALGQERITGLFIANDPQGFARAVAESMGWVAHVDGTSIVLSAS